MSEGPQPYEAVTSRVSAATGAHEVRGGIRDVWAAQGWETGPLGFPTTGDQRTPAGTGWYTLFQGGSVYASAGGVHAAKNVGNGPAQVLATYIVEKGKPLATLIK